MLAIKTFLGVVEVIEITSIMMQDIDMRENHLRRECKHFFLVVFGLFVASSCFATGCSDAGEILFHKNSFFLGI